jgi:hypothetical protein
MYPQARAYAALTNLASRGLRILNRQLVRRLPAAWRVGADHPQAHQAAFATADTLSVQGCLIDPVKNGTIAHAVKEHAED